MASEVLQSKLGFDTIEKQGIKREKLSVSEVQGKARCLRRHVIGMTGTAGSGYPGGSLSAADIVAALYFRVMRHDPNNPHWEDRDRFVLSKGHAAPLLYAALAESGHFPLELLYEVRRLDSPLQGHPDMTELPGVEASTGSLGKCFPWPMEWPSLAGLTVAPIECMSSWVTAK